MSVEERKRELEKTTLISSLNLQLRGKSIALDGNEKVYLRPEGFEKHKYQKHTLRKVVSSAKNTTLCDMLSYDEKGITVWRQEERIIEGVFSANKTEAPAIRKLPLSWETLELCSKSEGDVVDLERLQIPKESFRWLFKLKEEAIAEK